MMLAAIRHLLVPILVVLSGFISLEFSFPIAMGEFIAGIFGGMFVDFEKVPWLKFFSELGLLCIMFLAGFEIDMPILKRNFGRSLSIGLLSFFIPYVLVFVLSMLLDLSVITALVLGIALSTTSLAMVFSILKEATLTCDKCGQMLLGSAMIVDLLSMIALTLLFFEFSWINVLFMALLVGGLMMVKKIVIPVFQRYKGNRFEFELKFLLLILLSLGFISEGAGVHAAIIAFIMGMIFSDIDSEHEEIIEKLNTVVFSLLAPIFFFHAGTLLAFRELTFMTILMFFAFLIVATGGKFVGTYIGVYLLYGRDSKLARFGGILFNYRLSFGIVTAMYAFDKKIIDVNIFNIILLIVAISSVLSVVLERKLVSGIITRENPISK